MVHISSRGYRRVSGVMEPIIQHSVIAHGSSEEADLPRDPNARRRAIYRIRLEMARLRARMVRERAANIS